MMSVVTTPFFDWGHDRPPRHRVPRERHLRDARQGPDHDPSRYPRGAARDVRCDRPSGDTRPPHLAGRHRRRTAAGAPVRQRSHLVDQGLSNYWGYNTIGFLAPHNGYASGAWPPVSRRPEFKSMVKALHEASIEVILDVVYNHTAEGNEMGPDALLPGHRQCGVLPPGRLRKQHYYDTTGTGNSLLMRHPHVLQLIMDSLRYWVLDMHVDGFRFDLAATLARAVPRGRQAVGVLRHHPAGPGDLPGQADRRALGPRRRRLPGRELPAAVDGVERQVPRHRARLLARRAGVAGGVRLPAHRLERPVRALRPAPDRLSQLRGRARRLHLARPGLLQRASTTRPTARTTTTARATTGPGTAASKGRPTTRRSTPSGCSSSGTSSPR